MADTTPAGADTVPFDVTVTYHRSGRAGAVLHRDPRCVSARNAVLAAVGRDLSGVSVTELCSRCARRDRQLVRANLLAAGRAGGGDQILAVRRFGMPPCPVHRIIEEVVARHPHATGAAGAFARIPSLVAAAVAVFAAENSSTIHGVRYQLAGPAVPGDDEELLATAAALWQRDPREWGPMHHASGALEAARAVLGRPGHAA